ncbi:MAG: FKBP-type peptidyl-prolyl cis-trans isomerase [Bacteroidaceae bacterium]|nr:FKBP-type peptidyl-prolyl cis-trans isomerase [Bacteroidaceae bacterium]
MKKASIFMVIAAAAGFASCTAQAPKADLKNDVDSLSYAFGVAQSQGFGNYLTQQLRIDSAQIGDVVKGLIDGAAGKDAKSQMAYIEGLKVGKMIAENWVSGITSDVYADDSTKSIDKDNLVAGFIAGVLNKDQKMTMEEAQEYVQAVMEAANEKKMEAQFGPNREAGEKFLAENKTKEGVQVTPSGLQYKVIKQGKGAVPTTTDKVSVHYRGTLIDGTEFDSSYKRNKPTEFGVTQVIKGWTEALTMMPVGSKWEIYIPQELAYGSRNQGQIKPFSTLIFEVELLDIVK